MAAVRNMFGLAFTAGAAAIFLILTGLIGWQPPPTISFHNASWRLGTWTGDIIWSQIALGLVFLTVAGFAARRATARER
jgi:hypothetical protein